MSSCNPHGGQKMGNGTLLIKARISKNNANKYTFLEYTLLQPNYQPEKENKPQAVRKSIKAESIDEALRIGGDSIARDILVEGLEYGELEVQSDGKASNFVGLVHRRVELQSDGKSYRSVYGPDLPKTTFSVCERELDLNEVQALSQYTISSLVKALESKE